MKGKEWGYRLERRSIEEVESGDNKRWSREVVGSGSSQRKSGEEVRRKAMSGGDFPEKRSREVPEWR